MERRTFVKGMAAVGGTAAVGGLSGCAAAAVRAGPFLRELGGWIAQGVGFEIGQSAVDAVPDTINSLYTQLIDDEGEPDSDLYGWAPRLLDVSGFRGIVAGTFEDTNPFQRHRPVTSWSIHDNSGDKLRVPSVLSMGLAVLGAHLQDLSISRAERRHILHVNVWELVSGNESLDKASIYRAVNAEDRNIEVEWIPTRSKTELTQLEVRLGRVLKGDPPRWDETAEIGIASQKLWHRKDINGA